MSDMNTYLNFILNYSHGGLNRRNLTLVGGFSELFSLSKIHLSLATAEMTQTLGLLDVLVRT
jgi:hypothetical protein